MIIIPVKTLKAYLTAIAAGVKAAGFDTVRVSLDGGDLVFELQNGSSYRVPDAAGDGVTSFVYSFRNFKQEVGHIKDGNVILSRVLHDNGRGEKWINTVNDVKLWLEPEFWLMNASPVTPFAETLAIDLLALLQAVNAVTMDEGERNGNSSIFKTVHLDFDGSILSAEAVDGKHWLRRNITLTCHTATPRAFQIDQNTIAAWIEVLKVLVKSKRGDTIVSFAANEHWLSLVTADPYRHTPFTATVAGVLDYAPTSWVSDDKLVGDSEVIGNFHFDDVSTLQKALKALPAFDNPGWEGEFIRFGEGSLGSHSSRQQPEPAGWQIHGGALTLTQPDLYTLPKLYVQRDQLDHLLAGLTGEAHLEIRERKIVSTWDKSVTTAYMISVHSNRAAGLTTCANRTDL